MDTAQTIQRIERLYAQVLEMAQRQEDILRSGHLDSLPALLANKSRVLSQAQQLTRSLSGAGMGAPSGEIQAGLQRIATILAKLLEAEEECSRLTPETRSPVVRNQAIAAYGGKPG